MRDDAADLDLVSRALGVAELIAESQAHGHALRTDKVECNLDAALQVAHLVRTSRRNKDGVIQLLLERIRFDAALRFEGLFVFTRQVKTLIVNRMHDFAWISLCEPLTVSTKPFLEHLPVLSSPDVCHESSIARMMRMSATVRVFVTKEKKGGETRLVRLPGEALIGRWCY